MLSNRFCASMVYELIPSIIPFRTISLSEDRHSILVRYTRGIWKRRSRQWKTLWSTRLLPTEKRKADPGRFFSLFGLRTLVRTRRWLYSIAPSLVADQEVVLCSSFYSRTSSLSSCSHLSSKYFMQCQREFKLYRPEWFVDCCAKTKRNGGQRGEKTNVGSE